MKKHARRIIALFMCVVILFFSMGNVLAPKAEAANPAIAVGAVELVVWICGLVGITFASTAGAYQACGEAYKNIPDLATWVDNNLSYLQPGGIKFQLGKVALIELAGLIPKIKAFFSSPTNELSVPDYTYRTVYNVRATENISKLTDEQRFLAAPYRIADGVPLLVKNNVDYKYGVIHPNSSHYYLALNGEYCTMGNVPMMLNIAYDGKEWHTPKAVDVRIGFNIEPNGAYLNPYIVYMVIDDRGIAYYSSVYCDGLMTRGMFPITAPDIKYGQKILKYTKPISYSDSELEQALRSKANGMADTDTIDIGMSDPYNDVTKGKEETENPDAVVNPAIPATDWASIWEALGIKDLIKTLTENKPITLEESDFKAPQLPTGISDKFPFCVPFDLIALVKVFYATPQAPVFNIPVKFQELNYEHTFTFDFSSGGWDKIALAIRWGMTIMFLLGLTIVTRKMIKG